MPATITGGQTGTVGLVNAATAKTSTSGTVQDFTGLPAGLKRVTVMFKGVSTNGTSNYIIQLGTSGGFTTSGYAGSNTGATSGVTTASMSNGFITVQPGGGGSGSTGLFSGSAVIYRLTGNTWTYIGIFGQEGVAYGMYSGGGVALSAELTQVRVTAANGTDTFDAGQINILYE